MFRVSDQANIFGVSTYSGGEIATNKLAYDINAHKDVGKLISIEQNTILETYFNSKM